MKYVLKRLFGEELDNLIILNIITVIFSLAIITIGPAILALMGTLIKILDNRCNLNRVKEFLGLFKQKFWKGILLECIFFIYIAILLWCVSLAQMMGDQKIYFIIIINMAGFFMVSIGICLVTIISCMKISLKAAFNNAICMALGRLPRSFCASVITYILIYLAIIFYPVSILPYLLIMVSIINVLSLAILWPAIEELVLNSSKQDAGKEITNN